MVHASGREPYLLSEPLPRFTETDTGCWVLPQAAKSPWYTRISRRHSVSGRAQMVLAHRLFWWAFRGPIPDGRVIDHLCRRPACVNPWHLDVVDNKTKTLRGFGPTAINAQKIACVYGHIFSEETTRLTPSGWRACRICHARHKRESKLRKKIAALLAEEKR